ncbi:hypothetical protein FRC10_007569, partial [Ceratobasidium sp. 414]
MRLVDQLLDDDNFDDEEAPLANNDPNQAPNTSAQGELNTNGRRNRSDSGSDTEEAARLERRAFMEATMDEHNVRGPARQHGHRIADTHVMNRIKVAMLLPWASNYVTLFSEALIVCPLVAIQVTLAEITYIQNDILRSPDAWRVPEPVISQVDQWQYFTGEFKVHTTQVRSQNKITLYRMRKKGADINESIRAVAPQGMVVKEAHRARLAWIMLASIEFDELVEDRKQPRGKFWEWIGSELVTLKKRIQNDPRHTTDQERRVAISR